MGRSVTLRYMAGRGALVVELPPEFNNIPTLYSSMYEPLHEQADWIERIGRELVRNRRAMDLLFREGVPTSLEFEKYMKTAMWETLAKNVGYFCDGPDARIYGVTAITPAYKDRPDNDTFNYRVLDTDPAMKQSKGAHPITDIQIAGYSGTGLVMIPIPATVFAS